MFQNMQRQRRASNLLNLLIFNLSTMNFLPEGYEPPKSGSDFMKLEKGENKIRILKNPVIGIVGWTNDNKPIRFRDKKDVEGVFKNAPKQFWGLKVWNYKSNSIEILEITQASIIHCITQYDKNEEWGDPKCYDITIKREGDGMDTRYTVMPSPKKEITVEMVKALEESEVNLEDIFFKDSKEVIEEPALPPKSDIKPEDLPF